jgi:hypothetical protein
MVPGRGGLFLALAVFLAAAFFVFILPARAAAARPVQQLPQDEIQFLPQVQKSQPESQPGDPGVLLPDMRTLPPVDLRITNEPQYGDRLLRFTNSIANTGAGDLLLEATGDTASGRVHVQQVIHSTGSGRASQEMGQLFFHAAHRHWHWEGFSLYEIWSIEPGEGLERAVASSGKISYCLRDDFRVEDRQAEWNALLEGEAGPYRTYEGCNWESQGISAGWGDTYRYHLPGQWLDISRLPDGVYALKSTVNPDGLMVETDLRNNSAIAYFALKGDGLHVFASPPAILWDEQIRAHYEAR